MNIKTTAEGKTTIVKIDGRVDEKGAPALEATLSKLLESGKSRILIDVADVVFIGSSGIGKIITAARSAQKSGGQMALCSIPSQIKSTLDKIWVSNGTALMDKLLPIFDSPTKALKSF